MTERRKWALGLRFQGRMNCDSIPGVRKSREGLQLGEEECESDFANVESELLWRYSRDVRWADGHLDWSLRDKRDYKSGRCRYTNSVRNCECGLKVLRNLIFTKQTEATEPVWFQPKESRAVGLKAAKMLNIEAREGGKLQSGVSGITGNSTGRDLHYNSTTLEPNRIMHKVPQEHRKRILTLEREELIKRSHL